MGSGLFDFKKKETIFRGKTVTMEMRPMKTKEMAMVLPYFMDLQKFKEKMKVEPIEGEPGKFKVKIEDPEAVRGLMGMLEEAKPVILAAVRNLEGIEDTLETVCEEFYYFPLAMDITMALFRVTKIGEEETKNSSEPSSEASSGIS